MRRENDKYQFKEPFGRDIRKKMIDSQKKALQGPEKFLKLGQLKPTHLATVGHIATGVIQPEKKQAPPKPKTQAKDKKPKKPKKPKKRKRDRGSGDEDTKPAPVEKKGKKGDASKPAISNKRISDISLAEFDAIRQKFPGKIFRILLREHFFPIKKSFKR